jgi:hypothetical protein
MNGGFLVCSGLLRNTKEGDNPMSVVQEQFVIDSRGKKKGVLLSLRQYQKLMEDLHDLAVVAERRKEKPVSLEAMKRRLKKDGVL